MDEKMAIRSKLIEHVGQRIFSRIQRELKGIYGLRIAILKWAPTIDGDMQQVLVVLEG